MPLLEIRPISHNDLPQILRFVRELAVYEKAEHEVVATLGDLERTLFAEHPKVFGLMCEHEGQAIGFAIYFYNYSTWLGKHGIYLEDLYVTPESRGLGAGKTLLKRLAEIAVEQNCGRVEWSVLDWNEPAIEFYLSLNAIPMDEWTVYRLTGEALKNLAEA